MSVTFDDIRRNEEVLAFIRKGDANLGVLGYTDHANAHCGLVAHRAEYVLSTLGYSQREKDLAQIAGFMHDMGNAINRSRHAEYGSLLANTILRDTDMPLEDRVTVVSAIANHDESTGGAVDAVSAAPIIADKTDVRRNRVRTKELSGFDIHDRVNYAVTGNELTVDPDRRVITLSITVDESVCTMYDYFDIFLERMLLSRGAADMLSATFSLVVNGSKIL